MSDEQGKSWDLEGERVNGETACEQGEQRGDNLGFKFRYDEMRVSSSCSHSLP